MMAVGVARPMAQGQAITTTATPNLKAVIKGACRMKNQMPNTARASSTTAGTNQAETASAKRWIGALSPWASRTILMIWESRVASPVRVARTSR